jgi:hypothetical protein
MTERNLLAAAGLAALFALGACEAEPEVVGARRETPEEKALENRPQVELPPAIANSRVFRCRDSSLVYVDYFSTSGGEPPAANIRTEENGPRTRLTAAREGTPFTAEGYSVSANAEEAEIRVPGKSSQTCRS